LTPPVGNITILSGGSIILGTITSGIGNINLQSTGDINLSQGRIESVDGNITLLSGGNIILGTITSEGGNIYLDSSENIILGTIISTSGNINLQSNGSIKLGTIISDTGDIYIHAQDSIYTDIEDTNPSIQSKGLIQLTAINGEIGSPVNFLRVYTLAGGRLNATAKGNIYINGVGGDLYLGVLTSQSEDGTVYILTS
jgi:hypothetical protein